MLEELHIDLQPEARLRLLVALPALGVGVMLLAARQPIHPVSQQDAVHERHGQRLLMEASQVVRDLARTKVVMTCRLSSDPSLLENGAHRLVD